MTAQVAADLRAAASVLERDGWKQGSYHGANGCHCAMGAVAVAVSGARTADPDRWTAGGWRAERTAAARDALAKQVGAFNVPMWNDAEGRTASEVIAALRAAADKADQQ